MPHRCFFDSNLWLHAAIAGIRISSGCFFLAVRSWPNTGGFFVLQGTQRRIGSRHPLFQTGGAAATLSNDPVRPVAGVVLGRLDRKPHLLRDASADETSDAVILPLGGLRDIADGGSVFPA